VEPPGRVDQTVYCPQSSPCYFPPTASAIGVAGNSDLTEEIMRAMGKDPYRLEKAEFLSSTFELRMKMAIEARAETMKHALSELPADLDRLWTDARYSVRERRRILYELWYQMDSTTDGARASGIIERFIGQRVPCDGPDAYTADELAAFAKAHPSRVFPVGHRCGADKP
jgi:hypothetical protein